MENMKERCRHERNSWIIGGGFYEWCFVCGAIRGMLPDKKQNFVSPRTLWIKPTGNPKKNPWKTSDWKHE